MRVIPDHSYNNKKENKEFVNDLGGRLPGIKFRKQIINTCQKIIETAWLLGLTGFSVNYQTLAKMLAVDKNVEKLSGLQIYTWFQMPPPIS